MNRVDIEALSATGSYAVRSKRFRLDSQIMFRSKLNVLGGDGHELSVTLVPAMVAPLTRPSTMEAGGFVFIGGELPGHFEFELNVGGLSESDPGLGRHFAPVVTGALTRNLVGPVTGFVEWYNDTATSNLRRWNATADTGLLFLLSRDVQLDAGAYVGLWGTVPALTPFFGVSARL